MPIKRVKGDLLQLAKEGHFDVIVHGANCQSTMNSGIAKQIRKEFPEAYYVDVEDKRRPENKLGAYTYAVAEGYDFVIVNAYTQLTYNREGEPFSDRFEYDAFEKILRAHAEYHKDQRYGFPYIGMGLAGGDPGRILALLEEFSNNITGTVTLVEYDVSKTN